MVKACLLKTRFEQSPGPISFSKYIIFYFWNTLFTTPVEWAISSVFTKYTFDGSTTGH